MKSFPRAVAPTSLTGTAVFCEPTSFSWGWGVAGSAFARAIGACVTLFALAFLVGCGAKKSTRPSGREPLAHGTFLTAPLAARETMPSLEAEGWVNGPLGKGNRLLVVDVWADWCPMCRQAAPDLLRTYEKFGSRGVAFVSLSVRSRADVERFVKGFSIPWPNGYGVSHEAFGRLGAYSRDKMSATYNPGYEVLPTLFLVGSDGRVLWNDDHSRMRKDQRVWKGPGLLEAAIERALTAEPGLKQK